MLGDDDLAVFFDPEEHGEVVTLDGMPGLVAIWEQGTVEVGVGSSAVFVQTNLFRLPATQTPFRGAGLIVMRTGQAFRIVGEPEKAQHGTEWLCQAEPA